MARSFNGATSDRVNIGSAASIDNLAAGTLAAWVWVDSYTSARRLYQKRTSASQRFDWFFLNAAGQPCFQFFIALSSANLQIQADIANFANYGTGKWLFCAVLFDTATAASNQRMFIGDLTTLVAEPSAYRSQVAASGTQGDDSAASGIIANDSGFTLSFPGDIATFGIWNRALSLNELYTQQWLPGLPMSGRVAFYHLGYAATEQDYTGNGNTGTVTGASVAAHAPIPQPFVNWQEEDDEYVVVGGTTFTITPSGVLVPTSTLVRRTDKAYTGSLTPAGALAKSVTKPGLAGSLTPVGALAKQAQKALAGTVTLAGSLATLRAVLRTFSGALTPTGVMARQANKAAAGALAPSGSQTHDISKGLAGVLTPAGAAVKATSKTLAGTVALAGSFSGLRVLLRTFSGAIAPAGALVRTTLKGLAGSVTPTSTIAKAISILRAGTITPLGGLAKFISKVWAGLMGLAGALTTAIVGAVTPSAVEITGSYVPILTVAGGTSVPTLSVTGAFAPTIELTGSFE